jgi:hypothetical protein
MFILLSGLADTSHIDDVETRIGKTMRTSGIAITITSLTDVIAFCAGNNINMSSTPIPESASFSTVYRRIFIGYQFSRVYIG